SLLLEQTSGSAFSTQSTPIALLAAMSISVLPNSQNTAQPRPRLQPTSPTSKEKISATDAIGTRFEDSKLITSQPRNTSAAIHSSYSFSSPAGSAKKFISTLSGVGGLGPGAACRRGLHSGAPPGPRGGAGNWRNGCCRFCPHGEEKGGWARCAG